MGLKPDTPDRRDRLLFQSIPSVDAQPPQADNSAILPPVMDQKVVGACVGFSAATVAYGTMLRDGHRRPFVPSPVFLYREARVLGGYVEQDAGAEIRNAWKAANKVGLPPMSNLKPRFNAGDLADPRNSIFPETSIWRRQPSKSIYADAERRQALAYFKLPTLGDLLKCLADGYLAQVGFVVFRSMYGQGGPRFHVPDPNPTYDREMGGHAVTAYRYDKQIKRVFFRNSWSETAHEGKPDFTLSFSYLEQYSWDNWTCRVVEGARTT
jgi:hypothetical protein